MGGNRYYSFLIILIWKGYKLSSFQRQDLILLLLSFPTCFGLTDFIDFNTGKESWDVISEVTLKSKHLSCSLVGSMHMESDWLCSIKTLMVLCKEKEQMSVLPRPGCDKSDAFGKDPCPSSTFKTPGMGVYPGWLVYPNTYFSE